MASEVKKKLAKVAKGVAKAAIGVATEPVISKSVAKAAAKKKLAKSAASGATTKRATKRATTSSSTSANRQKQNLMEKKIQSNFGGNKKVAKPLSTRADRSMGFTVTSTNHSTGEKTTRSGKLVPVTREKFNSNASASKSRKKK